MPSAPIKEHWILRITPQPHRQLVIRVGRIFGTICSMVWMLGAFMGIYLGPLAFAVFRPAAPVSQPILWLIRVLDSDTFILTYTLIMLVFIGIVLTGHTLLEHLHNIRNA